MVVAVDGLPRVEPGQWVPVARRAVGTVLTAAEDPGGDDIELSDDLVRASRDVGVIGVGVLILDVGETYAGGDDTAEVEVEVGAHVVLIALRIGQDPRLT